MGEIVLETRNLTKEYTDAANQKIVVFEEVNECFEEGKMYAIFGPSGCGKTTLLNLLGLLDSPTSGEILVEGKSTSSLTSNEKADLRRDYIGFVFQDHFLIERKTVEGNLRTHMKINPKIRKEDYESRCKELLSLFGSENLLKRYPWELSGGEQQRVCIARALINDPAVILADEPTGNLDEENSRIVVEALQRLTEQGKTVIIVTHDLQVGNYADVIYQMRNRKLWKFTLEEWKEASEAEEHRREAARIERGETEEETEEAEHNGEDSLYEGRKRARKKRQPVAIKKKVLKVVKWGAVVAPVGVVLLYLLAVPLLYRRIGTDLNSAINVGGDSRQSRTLSLDETYRIMSYNIGFGAYNPEFTYILYGGSRFLADSKDAVMGNLDGISSLISANDPDFLLAQEVDFRARRSRGINEYRFLYQNVLPGYQAGWIENYHFPLWLFAIKGGGYNGSIREGSNYGSGLAAFSSINDISSQRYSLPAASGLRKFTDLDWCYQLIGIGSNSTKGGTSQLYIFNVQLASDSTGTTVVQEQLKELFEAMEELYDEGNYVIAGGDFGHDILGYSDALFGNDTSKDLSRSASIAADQIPEGFHLAAWELTEEEQQNLAATCRDPGEVYDGESSVWITDGFLYSDNITMVSYENIDTDFQYSYHNPVVMEFKLNVE